jgi:hypothetical protein
MDSLRRNDDSRKKKRLQREERKLAERKAKEEQLRRLKNAKKAELQEKMSKIRSICGSSNKQNTLDEETLAKLMEEEFDPDKFSKIMDEAYGEDFYGEEDIAWKSDKDVKQSMVKDNEDLLLEGEYYDDDNEDSYNDANDDVDEGGNDDVDTSGADIDEDYYYAEEDVEESSLDRQLKQKMLDELYKLDYEDKINKKNIENLKNGVLKFVIDDIYKLKNIKLDLKKIHNNNNEIHITPAFGCIDIKDIAQHLVNVSSNIIKLSLQQHKYIWNPDERGV